MTEAATTANVDRTTVHRWRKEPTFQAEFNQRAAELKDAARTRLFRLTHLAATTVEKAIQAGDARVALAVLRGTGLLSGGELNVGSDDPERLIREHQWTENQQQLLDALRG